MCLSSIFRVKEEWYTLKMGTESQLLHNISNFLNSCIPKHMNLSYATSMEGGGQRQNKYQYNVIYRCIVVITVYYTAPKKSISIWIWRKESLTEINKLWLVLHTFCSSYNTQPYIINTITYFQRVYCWKKTAAEKFTYDTCRHCIQSIWIYKQNTTTVCLHCTSCSRNIADSTSLL